MAHDSSPDMCPFCARMQELMMQAAQLADQAMRQNEQLLSQLYSKKSATPVDEKHALPQAA